MIKRSLVFQNRSVPLSVKLVLVTLTRCPTGEILISSVLYHMQFPCEDFADRDDLIHRVVVILRRCVH